MYLRWPSKARLVHEAAFPRSPDGRAEHP
ncbi:hypothetical protein [Actinomadura sp. 3N508]